MQHEDNPVDFKLDHNNPENILSDLSVFGKPLQVLLDAGKATRTTLPELRKDKKKVFDINGRQLSGHMITKLIEEAREAREASVAPHSHFNAFGKLLV